MTVVPAADRPLTIIAVHGNGGGGERFDGVAEHLPFDVHLLAPTLPGFGGRSLPPGGATSLEPYVADLAELVEASAGSGPLVLLGHGVGGSIVLHGLSRGRFPEVDAAVLHAPVGAALDQRTFPRLMQPPAVRETVRRTLGSRPLRPLLRRVLVPDVDVDTAETFLEGYRECEAFGPLFGLLDAEWFERLAPVPDLPVDVVWGAKDRVLSADQRSAFRALLPVGDDVVVEGWGHFPMLVDPADYARTVAAVARRLVGRDPGPVPLGHGLATRRPGKAARLDAAAAAGLPVPPAVVLTDLDEAGVERAARQVAGSITGRVVVRSAFDAEDGGHRSLAGAFTSVLDVDADDVPALCEALEAVLRSAQRADVEVGTRDVLVQRLVPAVRAGVAFVQRDFEDDLVDHVEGLAEGLVAGEVRGSRLVVPVRRPGVRATVAWQARLQDLLLAVRRSGIVDDADVEWADDGERCWLVQLRPVTAPPFRDEAFTLANHREILPDLPSAFMTSLITSAGGELFRFWSDRDPDLPRERPLIEEIAGRPLINLSLLTDTMRRLGLPTDLVTDSVGGTAAIDAPLTPLVVLSKLPVLAGLAREQLEVATTSRETRDELRAIMASAPADSFTEQVERARRVYVALIAGMTAVTSAISGPLALLGRLGVAGELLAQEQTAGSRIWADLAPAAALLDEEGREVARRGELPADPAFRAALRDHLAVHGHRGVHESDLAEPRFAEDPAPLLRMAADLRAWPEPGSPSPAARLAWPVWLQARRAIAAREDLRSDAMQEFATIRADLVGSAVAAAETGLLPDPAALWDLSVDEVCGLDLGVGFTRQEWDARRAEREELAGLRLPDLVHRSDDPSTFAPDHRPAESVLSGLPLTAGIVTGTVWHADGPTEEPPRVDGPLVLVAPAVSAGWITAFNHADAVVVETGGELSHGSIILREAGIPAVTNVSGATRLRTGQQVRVSAASGTVSVLEGGPEGSG